MQRQSRRSFLAMAGAGAASMAFAGFAAAQEGAQERPNILWIIAEDFSPDCGCYGNPLARTPNLDRLAKEGVMYTRAYTSAASCCPSRSGFMTGMWQNAVCRPDQRPARRLMLPDGVDVITKYFRDAGYTCANLRNVERAPYNKIGSGKDDFAFRTQEKVWDTSRWGDLKPNQPFYAQMTILSTHRGKTWWETPASMPKFQVDPDKVEVPPFYPDIQVVREDFADYYASMHALDEAVGLVLDRLERDGLAANTVVLFMADHGRPLPRGKGFLYEQGLRIPLIIRWPGRIKPGTVDDQLVSAVDLAPTFLDIAGADIPEHLHGRDFLGEDQGPPREYVFASRDRLDEAIDKIRCVIGERFKYIRNDMPEVPYTQPMIYRETKYPTWKPLKDMYKAGKLNEAQAAFFKPTKPAEELYDLEKDPWEINNLAGKPEYKQVLERMRTALSDRIDQVGDLAADPEPKQEYNVVKNSRHGQRVRWERSGQQPLTWGQKQRLKESAE